MFALPLLCFLLLAVLFSLLLLLWLNVDRCDIALGPRRGRGGVPILKGRVLGKLPTSVKYMSGFGWSLLSAWGADLNECMVWDEPLCEVSYVLGGTNQ